MDCRLLVKHAVAETHQIINDSDYDVKNESEFCNLFFSALASCANKQQLPLNTLRSEIRLVNQGKIDFGVRLLEGDVPYAALLEAKVWIRPLNVSHMSKANVATKKRKECVEDAVRLAKLIHNRACVSAALLVLERNSSHLRRLLGSGLADVGLRVQEEWLDLDRASAGRHQEHVGLIWINPNRTLNSDAAKRRVG
jgi:hypothetical protein